MDNGLGKLDMAAGKLIIKASLGEDIRRIPIHNDDLTYDELVLMMQRVFRGSIEPDEELQLKYKDEDGDLVSLTDSNDLSHAIQFSRLLRLTILRGEGRGGSGGFSPGQAVTELRKIRDMVNTLLDSLTVGEHSKVAVPAEDIKDSTVIDEKAVELSQLNLEESKEFDPLGGERQVNTAPEVASQLGGNSVSQSPAPPTQAPQSPAPASVPAPTSAPTPAYPASSFQPVSTAASSFPGPPTAASFPPSPGFPAAARHPSFSSQPGPAVSQPAQPPSFQQQTGYAQPPAQPGPGSAAQLAYQQPSSQAGLSANTQPPSFPPQPTQPTQPTQAPAFPPPTQAPTQPPTFPPPAGPPAGQPTAAARPTYPPGSQPQQQQFPGYQQPGYPAYQQPPFPSANPYSRAQPGYQHPPQ